MNIQLFQGLKTDHSQFGVRSYGSKIWGNHYASWSSLAHIPNQDFSEKPTTVTSHPGPDGRKHPQSMRLSLICKELLSTLIHPCCF